MIELLNKVLTAEQISKIKDTQGKDRTHPVKQIIEYNERNGFCYYNTKCALNLILEDDIKWLKYKSDKLADTNIFSSSSAVLGEIRAYGYMLDAGFNIKPLQESNIPTPDFCVIDDGNNEIIKIEVHSKQYNNEQSVALENFNNKELAFNSSQKSITSEICVKPFGKPNKAGESVTENVISKICNIKSEEGQFSETNSDVLWLDFQDEMWWSIPEANSTFPVRSWKSELTSGEFWYAYYGKIDLPIFNSLSIDEIVYNKTHKMQHNGRFRQQTKIDACIISLKRDLIILENPYSRNPLPEWFYTKLTKVRWFNIANSWMRWPDKNLQNRIDNEIKRIEALYEIGL
jgi:hypothetical protein